MERERKNIDKSGFSIRTNLGQEYLDNLCGGKKQPDTESKCNKHGVIKRGLAFAELNGGFILGWIIGLFIGVMLDMFL